MSESSDEEVVITAEHVMQAEKNVNFKRGIDELIDRSFVTLFFSGVVCCIGALICVILVFIHVVPDRLAGSSMAFLGIGIAHFVILSVLVFTTYRKISK